MADRNKVAELSRSTDTELKLIDPVKVVEELKRREELNYDGYIILHYRKGRGLISIREEYTDDEVPKQLIDKAQETQMFGKITFSFQKGSIKKKLIQRQIPLEEYYL